MARLSASTRRNTRPGGQVSAAISPWPASGVDELGSACALSVRWKAMRAADEASNTFRTQLNSFSVRHVLEVAGHLSTHMFPVIGCSRFLTETSWRTMDRETGTRDGRSCLGQARKRAEV
jgi:hypothetical protein